MASPPLHIHIRSSSIRNLPRCNRTEQCPDKTLDTVQTKLLSSFWPSNHGQSFTTGKIEWENLPVSAESLSCYHQRRSSQTLETACHACSSTSLFPISPMWDGIHMNFTSFPFWHRFQHNCLHSYTSEGDLKQTESYSRTDPMSSPYSSIKQDGCALQETSATYFNQFTLWRHLRCTYFAWQLHRNPASKNIPKYLKHVVWGST
jgi:hypothetical protein